VGHLDGAKTGNAAGLIDFGKAEPLQRAVDAGDEPWRLDPLEAGRADAATLGFAASDRMELAETGSGSALVRAHHAGATYEMRLNQPARFGPTDIWVLKWDPSRLIGQTECGATALRCLMYGWLAMSDQPSARVACSATPSPGGDELRPV
jgi:hypothetical protein